jgi:glycosyltransferase involved in cell wall biosynthesis
MKILVVSHACVSDVIQSFYSDLQEETGWSVTLVTPLRWTHPPGAPSEQKSVWPTFRGRIYRPDILFPGDIPRHIYRTFFISLLRQERPDAIYVHHEPYAFATYQVYLANLLTGRCPIGFYAAQNILKQYPMPIASMERWVFRQSSFAFPVTQTALEVLRTKKYTHVAEVLPLPLAPEIYHPNPLGAAAGRRQLRIDVKRFVIGYLGRFVPEKGLYTLLSAMAHLDSFAWDLVLVGHGPHESELRAMANNYEGKAGKIHFVGIVPHEQTSAWLSMFDVLVLPSESRPNWKEQFGRVLIEALACGTPVIGSDSGEIPHVIRKTRGGLIFPEGDARALAQAIKRIAETPSLRDSLTQTGQAAVKQLYDQSELVRTFASIVDGAVVKAN